MIKHTTDMKKYLIIAVASYLLLPLTSCEKTTDSTLNGLWQISKIVLNNTEVKPEDSQETVTLLLDSGKDQTFLKLSANNCSGKFSTNGDNSISFSGLSCTEMCCDTNFDIKILETLQKVNYYNLDVTQVTFYVDSANYIIANKVLPE